MKIIVYFSAVLIACIILFLFVCCLGPTIYGTVSDFIDNHVWAAYVWMYLKALTFLGIFVWAWAGAVGGGLPPGKPWKML